MRYSAVLLAIALPVCLMGCSKDPKERLEGTWKGQEVNNVQGPQKLEATAWAQGVRFEFDQSKMTVTVPSEKPRSGDYDIEDADDEKLTIRVAREAGGTDSANFTFDDDKLLWEIGDGREVVLARAD